MNELKCKVCGNNEHNSIFILKELKYGTMDEFKYHKCSQCGCLQITDVPNNMEKYYPKDYYAHLPFAITKPKINDLIASPHLRLKIGRSKFIQWILKIFFNLIPQAASPWYNKKYCDFNSKILDVGCGRGELLFQMQKKGFNNLHGIDLFISDDICQACTFNLQKGEIYDLKEKYDFIMLHHSFEHMEEPHKVINKLNELLSENGTLLICIPLVDCYVWRKYGIYGFQLDPPRHLFMHTVKSMNILAEKNGLFIEDIQYCSDINFMIASERYLRSTENFQPSHKETQILRRFIKDLNSKFDGDQANFILKKTR